MAYANAAALIDLAAYVSANRTGVSYAEIEARFGVEHRQAQRLVSALREVFHDLEQWSDDEGRKLFRLRRAALRSLAGVTAAQLAALDHAVGALAELGEGTAELRRLRDQVDAMIPDADARRIGPDLEALLDAQGFVARPGPREIVDRRTDDSIVTCLLECRVLGFRYASTKEREATARLVEPLGLLTGLRRYLVARPLGESTARKYRLDKIVDAQATKDRFVRPVDFDLQGYARRGFGAFVDDAEYGEVVWRFTPAAAERARSWLFHPDQVLRDEPDGSLLVSFHASGHLEMSWHLYSWGDQVEVVSPQALRRLVQGHQRSDFAALP